MSLTTFHVCFGQEDLENNLAAMDKSLHGSETGVLTKAEVRSVLDAFFAVGQPGGKTLNRFDELMQVLHTCNPCSNQVLNEATIEIPFTPPHPSKNNQITTELPSCVRCSTVHRGSDVVESIADCKYMGCGSRERGRVRLDIYRGRPFQGLMSHPVFVQALDEDQDGPTVVLKKLFEEDREFNQGELVQHCPI